MSVVVLKVVPGLEKFCLHLAPFVVLWIGFSLLYALMPNTQVRLHAAVVGGIVGGTLWQLNNLLNALYVSRVVTYSRIYGALGIVPVFLAGLYISWLIVLFGAQDVLRDAERRTLSPAARQRTNRSTRTRVDCLPRGVDGLPTTSSVA